MKRLNKFLLILLILLVSIAVCVGCKDGDGPIDGDETSDTSSITPIDTGMAPIEPTETRISFIAAGDNIMHGDIINDAKKRGNSAGYDFSAMYAGIADLIKSADIAFVNQEGSIDVSGVNYMGYPYFNAPPEAGEALVDLGFDVVNIANNHMLDLYEKGLLESIEYWESKKDILLIGGYRNTEDYNNIRILEKDGIKIAFLSYAYFANYPERHGGTGHIFPKPTDATVKAQVAKAKSMADFVIVSMHWGTETERAEGYANSKYGTTYFALSKEQTRMAQVLADAGVDVVLGHHPHVIQKVDELTGVNGNKMLIVYSMGNLISTMHGNFNLVGGLFQFDIVIEKDGAITTENAKLIPIMTHYLTEMPVAATPVRYGINVMLLEEYTEELVAKHGSQLRHAFTFDTLKKYVTDNIDTKYLSDFFK